MTIKTFGAAALALSLAVATTGAALAQTTPNSHNNATTGAPGGDNSGNAATGSGAAPSGK
ncbi:hypothetical protein [Methylobacterium sp. sgz302541]|uniref:hypothetical protein n=1 Tax=unclassified Methylobacterium TaxID=2615210 RepID=UPI003D33EADE